jgi:hypothetical protein
MGLLQSSSTGEEEMEGIRMGDFFFDKLAGRASSRVKTQAMRQWAAADDSLVSDVGQIALLWLFSMELLAPSCANSLKKNTS